MPQESRVKKSLLNARVNLIFYFLTLALSFFSRKVFLDCLGANFIGLTGTLYNLLGFLNLAELGIGSAIGYVLYKPLFDHNQQKINEIISVMGYLYRWIGFIILGTGCLLACFLPLIFPNTGFDLSIIYFAYFSFLASSLIGYFINYRQNLLGADQRNYVVTAYFQTATIIKTIIQMVSAYYTGSYYIWIALELSFGIIYSFILNWKINQTYPWLKSEIKEGKTLFKKYPEVIKYTKQLFVQQINGLVQFQTTPFLIYTFVSLETVAYYGNYSLVIDKIFALILTLFSSFRASIGNLIAGSNNEYVKDVFWEIGSLRFWIAGIVVFGCFFLMNSFITVWIGEKYILPFYILCIILIKFYFQFILDNSMSFLYGYGLFADVWASYTQSAIFLVCAIVGGYLWGLAGILMASLIGILIINGIWKPYYLYKSGFKFPISGYWLSWMKYNVLNVINIASSFALLNFLGMLGTKHTLGDFVVQAIVVLLTYTLICTLTFSIFSKHFRVSATRLYSQITRKGVQSNEKQI